MVRAAAACMVLALTAIGARADTASDRARALAAQGNYRGAWLLWVTTAAEADAAGDTKRARDARKKADALAPKLSTVVIEVDDPSALGTVYVNGRKIALAKKMVERLDTTKVEVVVLAEDRRRFVKALTIETGEQAVVEVPPVDELPKEPVVVEKKKKTAKETPDAAVAEPASAPAGSNRAWNGIAITGGAVTLLSIGGVVYGSSSDSDGIVKASGIVGAIGLTAAIVATSVLIVRGDRKRVAIAPVVTPDGAAASMVVRW